MKAIGRPPSFNEAMKGEVVRLVSQGFSVRLAARWVGCAEGTIRYARKRDPQFARQFEQGQIEREMELLRIIREAAKDPRQWRAGAWWLERMFPERYAPCKGKGISAQQLVERVDQFFDDIEGRVPADLHQSLHSEFQRLMRKSLPGEFDGLLDEEVDDPADDLAATLLDASRPEQTAAVEVRLSHAPELSQLDKEASSVLRSSERSASATELEAIVSPQVSPQIPPPCAKNPGSGRHGEVGRPAPNEAGPAPNGAVEEPGPKGVSPQIPPSCAKSPGSGRHGGVGGTRPEGGFAARFSADPPTLRKKSRVRPAWRGRGTRPEGGFAARFSADPPILRKKSRVRPAWRGRETRPEQFATSAPVPPRAPV
jgi:hypothetical protein